MKNIVLVGFMGTGKTAAAKLIASDLELEYVSIDALIAGKEKTDIKSIFSDKGEPYFRDLEKSIVKEISNKNGQVIDTGGGIVIDPENVIMLKKNGIVICLWASPGVVHKRTKHSEARPLLNVSDPEMRIKELLDSRREYYERADFHINTDELDAKSVADAIREIFNEEKN